MKAPPTFIELMRKHVRRSYFKSTVLQLLIALCLISIFPFLLIGEDTTDGLGMRVAVALAEVLIGLAWIYFAIRNAWRRRTPAGEPVAVHLSKSGEPGAVAAQIDQEFGGMPFKPRRIYVGKTWLCYAWKKQVSVFKIDDLVWAYFEKVRRSVNLIPTGTTKQLVVWRRNGTGAAMPVRKAKDVEQAIAELKQAAPWMLLGYTEALKESWNSDRQDFLAAVDAGRQGGTKP
jgi:hypothetical protein